MTARVAIAMLAGLASGLIVLGVGGRLLMRALTVALVESPRFTWTGTLAVLGTGAAWGAITGPLLLPIRAALSRGGPVAGAVHGVASFVLAGFVFVAAGGASNVVAPPFFLVLSGISFPALFLLYGLAVERLASRRGGP
jgi:hypothetical protein